MQQRPPRKRNTERRRHIVHLDFRFGAPQQPWLVINLPNRDLTLPIHREKTIALGQEMFERPWHGHFRLAGRPINGAKLALRKSRMRTFTVVTRISGLFHAHSRLVIRQPEPAARGLYNDPAFAIQ